MNERRVLSRRISWRVPLQPRSRRRSLTHRVAMYRMEWMNSEALKGHLDLLLLAAIQPRPAHGYAIADALRARSDGAFDLPEGTLYPALHRLEHAGLVSSRWSEVNGRRRRVYQLTAKGQRELAERQKQWRDFSRAIFAVVKAPA
jgi:PadR family transcriptional regulator